jgi:hypothetical protein
MVLICRIVVMACGAAVVVRSRRCPVRAQESKVRLVDDLGLDAQVGQRKREGVNTCMKTDWGIKKSPRL